MRKALAQWNTKVYEMRTKENIGIIQKFLRSKLNKPNEKRKDFDQLADAIKKILERIILNKVGQEAKEKQLLRAIKKSAGRNKSTNKKILRDKFKLWLDLLPLLEKEDAVNKIQNAFRNLRSRNKLNGLKERNNKIVKKLKENLIQAKDFLVRRLLMSYVDS